MRKLIVSAQMTLDGFISGPGGEMDWLMSGEEEWQEIFKSIQSVDTILLGRKMYPEYATFWRQVLADPDSDRNFRKYAEIADRTSHVVFSNTLSEVDWENTRIAKNAQEEIQRLKQEPGKNLMVFGGAEFVSSLLRHHLVDELRITLNPNILGDGLHLFNNISERQRLELVETKPLSSGNVILKYELSAD